MCVLASSSANNTVVISRRWYKDVEKKKRRKKTHAIETLGIVHIVERSSGGTLVFVTVLREQSGEPRAESGLVRVCRDVPNENDAAGRVRVTPRNQKRRRFAPCRRRTGV